MVVCYTGGGTLGHVYPALAVHEVLGHDANYEAFFIGRRDRQERELVERTGMPFYGIAAGKVRRYRSARNLATPFLSALGFLHAMAILLRRRADVLFSKGGFVTPPVVLAAWLLGIPVISHESDLTAGLATRINSRFSRLVCTPTVEGYSALKAKVVATGSPIRSSLLDYKRASAELPFLKEGEPLLLVLGGSKGATEINALVHESLDELVKYAHVYHQCGPGKVIPVVKERYTQVEFIDHLMPALLDRADLVVSRAGANTIAELALFATPALLIPLSPSFSRGDQVENAKALAEHGAARVLLDQIDARTFASEVRALLDDEAARRAYGNAIGTLAQPESAALIADLIRGEKRRRSCSGE